MPDCVPHLYPLDEHDWSRRPVSDEAGDVHLTTVDQTCRACGWRVVVTTGVVTLPGATPGTA